MKKLIKVIGILLVSALILLPLKTNAQEPVWTQELDLNDSVSSAIAKVEDGVVVMQYEGVASANNLLIKYDFNGKKIWEIDNDYGYNIESVSDGFIVWSETKITKIDKDKNILWSKDIELRNSTVDASDRTGLVGLGNKLIELADRYIIGQTAVGNNRHNDLFSIDFNGNIIQRTTALEFYNNNSISTSTGNLYDVPQLLAIGQSSDSDRFIIGYKKYNSSSFYIAEVSRNFIILRQREYNYSSIPSKASIYPYNGIIKIVETDKGYITVGYQMLYFLKDGKIRQLDKEVLDIIKVGDSIYTYEFMENEDNYVNMYDTYIVKYDSALLKEKIKIKLPLIVNSSCINQSFRSGFSQMKNRVILDEEKFCITLNTPISFSAMDGFSSDGRQIWKLYDYYVDSYEIESEKYTLTSYKLNSFNGDNNSSSGIINNIIKNPQTNSIIIIVVFVVLILVISIISYLLYMKKAKKKLSK